MKALRAVARMYVEGKRERQKTRWLDTVENDNGCWCLAGPDPKNSTI